MGIEPDPDRRDELRAIADDVRDTGGREAEQVAAILYRVSDLYDPAEETSPRQIYVNMRNILRVREGSLERGTASGDDE
ncbi:MAG: hypothetical protein ABEJ27_06795 [Halodesulfurarchaeum sp.]